MIALVIVVVVFLWTAGVAAQKGRSAWGWGLATLLIGVFALILVYVLPPKEKETR
jgi:hypothetical protein